MPELDFFSQYENLPTKSDQKQVRHEVLKKTKVEKITFYKWKERKNIPDEKANAIAIEVINQYREENKL